MRRRVERRRKERVEEELSLGPGIVEMLEQHAARVKHILDVMRALKTDLSSGPPPGHHLEWLITEHPADFAPDPPHERDDRMDGETGMWWTKDYGQRVRTALDKHLQRLTPLWIRLAEFEEQQLEAAIDAAGLLDEKEVVRLTRYEKTIDHLLDRATERPSPCPLPGGERVEERRRRRNCRNRPKSLRYDLIVIGRRRFSTGQRGRKRACRAASVMTCAAPRGGDLARQCRKVETGSNAGRESGPVCPITEVL